MRTRHSTQPRTRICDPNDGTRGSSGNANGAEWRKRRECSKMAELRTLDLLSLLSSKTRKNPRNNPLFKLSLSLFLSFTRNNETLTLSLLLQRFLKTKLRLFRSERNSSVPNGIRRNKLPNWRISLDNTFRTHQRCVLNALFSEDCPRNSPLARKRTGRFGWMHVVPGPSSGTLTELFCTIYF
jgi:hypothetical protein